MKCEHYCAVGGHTWSHDAPTVTINRSKLPDCKLRSETTEMIRYFAVCDKHKGTLNTPKRFSDPEDY